MVKYYHENISHLLIFSYTGLFLMRVVGIFHNGRTIFHSQMRLVY